MSHASCADLLSIAPGLAHIFNFVFAPNDVINPALNNKLRKVLPTVTL
jgi:hypothetical protein